MMPSLEEGLIGREIRCVTAERRRHRQELQPEGCSDFLSDLILNREYICRLPVEALRPEMRSIGGSDQLHRDTNSGSSSAHGALKDVGYPQRRSDLADVLIPAFENKGRGPR